MNSFAGTCINVDNFLEYSSLRILGHKETGKVVDFYITHSSREKMADYHQWSFFDLGKKS